MGTIAFVTEEYFQSAIHLKPFYIEDVHYFVKSGRQPPKAKGDHVPIQPERSIYFENIYSQSEFVLRKKVKL